MLETRAVRLDEFEIRAGAGKSAGRFSGYANRFGVVDDYGTRFVAGAWKAGGLEGKFPLLWMHDPTNPVGNFRAKEDSTGLYIDGNWDDTDVGRLARSRAEGSAPDLSVGFKRLETREDDRNAITAARLREVSQLTLGFASAPGAAFDEVRRQSPRIIYVVRPRLSLERRRAAAVLDLLAGPP